MTTSKRDSKKPLYMISVVSKLLEVHPQTLRMYEREGFVSPQRINRQRIYSDEDIERLNLVINLTRDLGVNKAGVDIILRMRNRISVVESEMREIMRYLEDDVRQQFEQKLRQSEQLARGRATTIDYDVKANTVKLTGDAWLTDGQNEIRGDTLIYDIGKQRVVANPNEKDPGGVQITINPRTTPPPPKRETTPRQEPAP
jgi:MerR family transcriptional regulator/heat shock protein HspR